MRKTKDIFSEYEVVIDLIQSSKTVIRLKTLLLSSPRNTFRKQNWNSINIDHIFFSIARFSVCFGLYFLSSQNSYVEILAHQGDGINGWGPWEVLKSWGWNLDITRSQWPRRGPSRDQAGTPISDVQPPDCGKEISVAYKPPILCGLVTTAQMEWDSATSDTYIYIAGVFIFAFSKSVQTTFWIIQLCPASAYQLLLTICARKMWMTLCWDPRNLKLPRCLALHR